MILVLFPFSLRESVAAFLTSGDLWISWVAGKDTFEELLLDYEPTVACGLWMKSSCSTFLHGPIPYYCPISFGQKIDPKGQYIRTFCPELRNMPSESHLLHSECQQGTRIQHGWE